MKSPAVGPVAGAARACWRPVIQRFRLDTGELCGELVLEDATPGLRGLRFGSAAAWPGPLLAVAGWNCGGGPVRPVGRPDVVSPPRRRSNTVDVLFESDKHCPVRVQAYWQVPHPQSFHVQLLATTAQFGPFERFQLHTLSRLPAGPVLVAVRRGDRTVWVEPKPAAGAAARVCVSREAPARKQTAARRSDRNARLGRPFAFPALLYRPAGASWSYVELSHADDCGEIVLRSRGRGTDVGFGLFGVDLEKGVILRGRVWARFVPRDADMESATAEYDALVAAPPPLGV